MFTIKKYYFILVVLTLCLPSCGVLENASQHGFTSGFYKTKNSQKNIERVYVDVMEDKFDVYHLTQNQPDKILFSIPGQTENNMPLTRRVFTKKSIDIDLTSNIFKYRPSVFGLPGLLTTDFNAAIYVGWRHDYFIVSQKRNPLGKTVSRVSNRGYDFGVFLGPGTSTVGPFTTRNTREADYSGMIIQTGMAGFVESNLASFGVSVGLDYLLTQDRDIWIYTNKPFVGFIIGIALN